MIAIIASDETLLLAQTYAGIIGLGKPAGTEERL
jgi:hypothetical protein